MKEKKKRIRKTTKWIEKRKKKKNKPNQKTKQNETKQNKIKQTKEQKATQNKTKQNKTKSVSQLTCQTIWETLGTGDKSLIVSMAALFSYEPR